MDIRQITPRYFVAPQIEPGDMESLRAQGITRILCNRPDAEVPPSHQALGVETDDTVLAYCASGTRSTIAWALGQAGEMDSDAIIEAARQGGYDLENMRPMLGQSYS